MKNNIRAGIADCCGVKRLCGAYHASQQRQRYGKTAQPAVSDVQQRALADGLYEMALSPAGDALYVASAEGFKDVQGGVVYKLDPKRLKRSA